jgi:hypothetical protein
MRGVGTHARFAQGNTGSLMLGIISLAINKSPVLVHNFVLTYTELNLINYEPLLSESISLNIISRGLHKDQEKSTWSDEFDLNSGTKPKLVTLL